jgi:hemerythrin superfamily protein
MHAIDLLDWQHEEVLLLLRTLTERPGNLQQKRARFQQAADALSVHATLEELQFYPAVRAADTEAELRRSLEEHLAMKRRLADLMLLDAGDASFDAKLVVLRAEVEAHVREEREQLFPHVRELLDDDQQEAIGQLMTSSLVELEKGEPRRDVLGQVLAAPPLDAGYVGAHGGNFASRLFPHVVRLIGLPLELISLARRGVGLVRGLLRPARQRAATREA